MEISGTTLSNASHIAFDDELVPDTLSFAPTTFT
jgi:hypothetical protein